MTHSALTPVFVGLRTGLHVLVVALAALVIARAIMIAQPVSVAVIALTALLLATYALGGYVARAGTRSLPGYLWLLALSVEWICLVWLIPEAAYLVFPLFFLYLHLLARGWGTVAVIAATALSIVALGFHGGWSVGGVIGPLVGAGVAVVIGIGYQSLAREAMEREQLMTELIATRGQLASTEHEAGVLAERARLAREIHDTVAQGLSSIQMLLHAAERADPTAAGIEHVRLARDTAASNLADTRRFIRELSPTALVAQGMGAALRRLAETQLPGIEVHVRVADSLDLPMPVQTAFLRIAQGAVANVVQHAEAREVTIAIERDHSTVQLTVTDDGRGFDLQSVAANAAAGLSDSFGITATRERVEQLGGTLTIDTAPGRGTSVVVVLKLESELQKRP